ncbi:Signal peptidase complex catalytic subunit SEC11A [Triticum urartu]|uniref:signal peptidase I n=1 Tax=Triticum urartu TaxID=4572 RepID=M7ZR97_TRIUA|nr:Signal peptidase complex catalytic subunit SEC11A [Triticum urartu]
MGFIGDQVEAIRSMQVRQVLAQIISLGMIVTSALIIWKGLMVATGSESPVVVVLSGSMEPGFKRGDILFLRMSKEPIRTGEIVVFNVDGREIPIVHRVIKVHERQESAEVDILTKGDNNFGDDRLLYAHGQLWLQQHHIMGRAVGYLPYVGWVTIVMTEKPIIKVLCNTRLLIVLTNDINLVIALNKMWPVLALWRIWERSYMVVSSGQFAVVVAPVLQIMHELLELCLSPPLPLSIEHMKVDSRISAASFCAPVCRLIEIMRPDHEPSGVSDERKANLKRWGPLGVGDIAFSHKYSTHSAGTSRCSSRSAGPTRRSQPEQRGAGIGVSKRARFSQAVRRRASASFTVRFFWCTKWNIFVAISFRSLSQQPFFIPKTSYETITESNCGASSKQLPIDFVEGYRCPFPSFVLLLPLVPQPS